MKHFALTLIAATGLLISASASANVAEMSVSCYNCTTPRGLLGLGGNNVKLTVTGNTCGANEKFSLLLIPTGANAKLVGFTSADSNAISRMSTAAYPNTNCSVTSNSSGLSLYITGRCQVDVPNTVCGDDAASPTYNFHVYSN